MLVELSDSFQNATANENEEAIGHLIEDASQDKVGRMAKVTSFDAFSLFIFHYIPNHHAYEHSKGYEDHYAHNLADSHAVFDKMRGLFREEIAYLEEDDRLNEL